MNWLSGYQLEAAARSIDELDVPVPHIEPVAIWIDPGGYALIVMHKSSGYPVRQQR